jgi:HEAT repeat protein
MPLVRSPSAANGAQSGEPGDLGAALSSGSIGERWAAARAISASAVGIPALAKALRVETDPRVREALFTGLARIATPESALVALPYLRSDDAALRTAALDALRAMPRAAAPHLKGLLSDPEADIRLLSCEIVRSLNDGETTRLLYALLETENNINVCASAADVLSEIGSVEALPYLQRCGSRFKDVPFLGFAIEVASDRLRSQSPP